MFYNELTVTRYIYGYCLSKGHNCNITKLQKLLYACYGAVLAVTGRKLMSDGFKAWPYGPVVPKVRTLFKTSIEGKTHNLEELRKELESDPATLSAIDTVLETFSGYNATTLVAWSHEKGSPWDMITKGGQEIKEDLEIPDWLIKGYFESEMIRKKNA